MKRLAALLFLVALCGCAGKSNPTGFDQSRTKYAKAVGFPVETYECWTNGKVEVTVRLPNEKVALTAMDSWTEAIEKHGKSAAEEAPNAHIR